jgi:hypothetical protein
MATLFVTLIVFIAVMLLITVVQICIEVISEMSEMPDDEECSPVKIELDIRTHESQDIDHSAELDEDDDFILISDFPCPFYIIKGDYSHE